MKMNSPHDETPAELKGITEVLEKSLRPGKEEEVPPMPDDLRDRLKGQYSEVAASARTASVSAAASASKESVWDQLKSLFAQPAFAGSLAALVLVGVLGSLLMRSGSEDQDASDVMRGTPDAITSAQTIIILFDLNEEQTLSVTESGYFEQKHLYTTSSASELADWVAQDGASIVIDGAAGEIRHEDGRQMALPLSEISDAVLQLLSE